MLLGMVVTSKAPRAEVLWTVLARSLPHPWRVEALVMLAFFAFGRGDQPLAAVSGGRCLAVESGAPHGRHPRRRITDRATTQTDLGVGEFAYGVAQLAGVRMPRRIVHTRRPT